MKNKIVFLLLTVLSVCCAVAAVACGGSTGGGETPSAGKEFTEITFTDKTVTYDGEEYVIEIDGSLPEGTSVEYNGNKGTDAGEYSATAKLSGEGYKDKTLSAKLKIEKAECPATATMEDVNGVYSGEPYTVEVSLTGELPEGGKIVYTCAESTTITNSATDAGIYTITASLEHKNYVFATNPTAKIVIEKAVYPTDGFTFKNETVDYDGKPHKIEVAGAVPQGGTIKYTCENNPQITNTATAAGTYVIKASLEHKNYKFAEELTAKLIIRVTGKDRYIASYNNTIYFANALDRDKLYSYTAGGEVTRISSDIPSGFAAIGSKFYFQSNSLLFSSIKSIDSTGNVDSVAAEKGEYLCTDGNYLYYAKNALTNNNSGIYKINVSAAEPQPVLVSEGKAENLTYYGGNIYFADGANGNKLSKVSINGGARTVVVDEKITCLTLSGSSLYFTVDNLLGNYIARYDISSNKKVKLTQDAGAGLTVYNNYLYYINVDLLSSNLFGKGIYRVQANASSDSNAVGEKIIEKDNSTYSSLTLLSANTLAYYRVNDQMLCSYNISGKTETEILKDFVAPEYTPLSKGSKLVAYGETLYYLDIYNDKALYSYNPQTKDFARVTSCKVSDFTIIGDDLYFNGITYGVNNDLYKVNLLNGGEPQKISTYDCNDIVTDGTNIFYVEKNAVGARTAIHVIKSDGTDEIMYTKGAEYLAYSSGYIYFVDGNDLLKMPATGYTQDTTVKVVDKKAGTFVIDGTVIYFRELYGVGQKRLSRVNTDGNGYTVVYSDNTDPLKIAVQGDKLYFYTDTVLGTSGIYVIDKDTVEENKKRILLLARGSAYYAEEFTLIGNTLYFVNYYNNLGDSHLYALNVNTKAVERVDV